MGEEDTGPKRVPALAPGLDLTALGLSPLEGMVAACVDGRTDVPLLAQRMKRAEDEVRRIIERLHAVGILRFEGDAPSGDVRPRITGDLEATIDYGTFVFSPALMQAESDLSTEEKKRVIYLYEHLEQATHYELLDVKRTADPKDIKRAYFERSKDWHPDRFARKSLGPFKRMVSEIFKQLQEAQRTLSNAERKKAYDKTVIFDFGDEELGEVLAVRRKEEREARRQHEAEDRRKRRNPVRQRLEKAKSWAELAEEKHATGDLAEAYRLIQLASNFDRRPEYEAKAAAWSKEVEASRLEPLIRRGKAAEQLMRWEDAEVLFSEAVRLSPEHRQARLRLANTLLMAGRPLSEVFPHAHKAVALAPDEAEAHYVLGRCFEHEQKAKSASREYNRALSLRPNYADAKKRLKRLKWGL